MIQWLRCSCTDISRARCSCANLSSSSLKRKWPRSPKKRTRSATFMAGSCMRLMLVINQENEFPAHLWEAMGNMGLLGITAPEEYGGLGRSYFDHVLVMEEVRST